MKRESNINALSICAISMFIAMYFHNNSFFMLLGIACVCFLASIAHRDSQFHGSGKQ
jgi:1,4-dihydroxy-2-naphthoate octaprenyltransferase